MAKTIESTLQSLQRIIDSDYPRNPKWWDRHNEKTGAAEDYRDELKRVQRILEGNGGYTIVTSKKTFEEIESSADFVEKVEEGMEYVRMIAVANFPARRYKFYLWLAPLRSL